MNSAVISPNGVYRYQLRRDIKNPTGNKKVCFVMLNPSTADAEKDDPTIRRCKHFTRREGGEELIVVNMFAFRATDPKALRATGWPIVGSQNPLNIVGAVELSHVVVVAWGAHAKRDRSLDMLDFLSSIKNIHGDLCVPQCLGRTRAGQPRHPLMVPNVQPLIPYDRNWLFDRAK